MANDTAKIARNAREIIRLGGFVNLVICNKRIFQEWYDYLEDEYYATKCIEGVIISPSHIILPYILSNPDELLCFKENIKSAGGVQIVGLVDSNAMLKHPELYDIKYNTVLFFDSERIEGNIEAEKCIIDIEAEKCIKDI